MKKYNIIIVLFLAQFVSTVFAEVPITADAGPAKPAKKAISSTPAPSTKSPTVPDDETDTEEETVKFPVGPVGVHMKNFIRAAQVAHNKLEDEDAKDDNLEKILYVIRNQKYKKVVLSPSKKGKTLFVTLQDSSDKDAKDGTAKLTEKESNYLWEALPTITRSKRKSGGGRSGPGGSSGSNEEEDDPDYDNDDTGTSSDPSTKKRSTPASRDKRLNPNAKKPTPQRQQPRRNYNSPNRGYNPYGGRGYNPQGYRSHAGKFQVKPKEIQTAHIIEGILPKQTPQKKELKRELPENKMFKKHVASRVPEPQSKGTKLIYPSPQNLEHEQRTHKVERKFTGLKEKKKTEPKSSAIKKVTTKPVPQEEPGLVNRIQHWFQDRWKSFINLFNWTK